MKNTRPYRLVIPSSRKKVSPKQVTFFRMYCSVSSSAGDRTNSRTSPLNRLSARETSRTKEARAAPSSA